LFYIELLELPRNLLENGESREAILSEQISSEGAGNRFVGLVDLLK
jgi:hypothetical protein